jgi:hypothetical protein
MELIDNDYLSICNIMRDITIENDKMKKNLYKIRYIKQSVKAECMIKGLKILSKIKSENVIIDPYIITEINKHKNIEEFSCLLVKGENNIKTLTKGDEREFSDYYIIENDEEENTEIKYRKIILLSYSKID